jgi:hypothetical protein
MGRPLKQIDEKQVEELASIDCTNDEIAAVMGCSADTIERRFAGAIKRGRENGKASLKRQLWKSAMGGRDAVLIFLAKNRLGYADKVDNQVTNVGNGLDAFDRVEVIEPEYAPQPVTEDDRAPAPV